VSHKSLHSKRGGPVSALDCVIGRSHQFDGSGQAVRVPIPQFAACAIHLPRRDAEVSGGVHSSAAGRTNFGQGAQFGCDGGDKRNGIGSGLEGVAHERQRLRPVAHDCGIGHRETRGVHPRAVVLGDGRLIDPPVDVKSQLGTRRREL